MKRMMSCCAALLALSSCGPREFCQVVPGPKVFAPQTSRAILATDRDTLRQIGVENEYGSRHCDWKS